MSHPIITKQQMFDFIASQPADRPIVMTQCYSSDVCGCLAIHYGQTLTDQPFFASGSAIAFNTMGIVAELEEGLSFNGFVPFMSYSWKGTYGKLQQYHNLCKQDNK
jgi:hypothetical protein